MHIIGPSPKLRFGIFWPSLVGLNRSGSNFKGSGKFLGSLPMAKAGIMTLIPFSIVKSLPGIVYGFVHFLVKIGREG